MLLLVEVVATSSQTERHGLVVETDYIDLTWPRKSLFNHWRWNEPRAQLIGLSWDVWRSTQSVQSSVKSLLNCEPPSDNDMSSKEDQYLRSCSCAV